jgi:PHD/YefM family antitoxin component YafN of YafNO toxin-antitoxin module
MAKAVYRSRASEPYASRAEEAAGPRYRAEEAAGPRSRAEEAAGPRYRAEEAAGPRHRAESQAFQTAEDIIPIAELTLNGKPAAVVMSPREYDRLAYQSRFIDSVAAGLADVQAGRTYDGDEAVAELLGELGVKKPRRTRSSK